LLIHTSTATSAGRSSGDTLSITSYKINARRAI
jgi:hypothetical protein